MSKRVMYSMGLVSICMIVGVGIQLYHTPEIVGDEAAMIETDLVEDNLEGSSPGTIDVSKIYGKIQIVNSFPDYKVQVVDSFPDLRVQVVNSFPDKPGKWQMVKSFPDFKIQLVDSFPDFKIKYVSSFPGTK